MNDGLGDNSDHSDLNAWVQIATLAKNAISVIVQIGNALIYFTIAIFNENMRLPVFIPWSLVLLGIAFLIFFPLGPFKRVAAPRRIQIAIACFFVSSLVVTELYLGRLEGGIAILTKIDYLVLAIGLLLADSICSTRAFHSCARWPLIRWVIAIPHLLLVWYLYGRYNTALCSDELLITAIRFFILIFFIGITLLLCVRLYHGLNRFRNDPTGRYVSILLCYAVISSYLPIWIWLMDPIKVQNYRQYVKRGEWSTITAQKKGIGLEIDTSPVSMCKTLLYQELAKLSLDPSEQVRFATQQVLYQVQGYVETRSVQKSSVPALFHYVKSRLERAEGRTSAAQEELRTAFQRNRELRWRFIGPWDPLIDFDILYELTLDMVYPCNMDTHKLPCNGVDECLGIVWRRAECDNELWKRSRMLAASVRRLQGKPVEAREFIEELASRFDGNLGLSSLRALFYDMLKDQIRADLGDLRFDGKKSYYQITDAQSSRLLEWNLRTQKLGHALSKGFEITKDLDTLQIAEEHVGALEILLQETPSKKHGNTGWRFTGSYEWSYRIARARLTAYKSVISHQQKPNPLVCILEGPTKEMSERFKKLDVASKDIAKLIETVTAFNECVWLSKAYLAMADLRLSQCGWTGTEMKHMQQDERIANSPPTKRALDYYNHAVEAVDQYDYRMGIAYERQANAIVFLSEDVEACHEAFNKAHKHYSNAHANSAAKRCEDKGLCKAK